jgi:RNA polymerase sigma-70 factor (ECF subfamily)
MTDDSEQAEAIVQETFLRAWQRLRSWRPPASLGGLGPEKPFFSYLVTIALNLARDQLRRDRRLDFGGLAPLENVLVDPQPGPESRLEESEILERLAQAVADLPPAYRVVIALRYDAGLSYQEISQALGIPLNTVRTHLRRAKTHLRKALRNAEE